MDHETIIRYQCLGRDWHRHQIRQRQVAELAALTKANWTIGKHLTRIASEYPDKPMVIAAETGETWTFSQMEAFANRVARLMLARGFKEKDAIAVYMTNSPLLMAIMLGLSKVGVISACINTHLTHEGLLQAVEVGECRGLICDDDLAANLKPIEMRLSEISNFKTFSLNGSFGENFGLVLSGISDSSPPIECDQVNKTLESNP